MVDSEYSADGKRFSKTSIGAIMKNLVMLKFVPDHLKLKQCETCFEKVTFYNRLCS